jgi:hypothetical protein
MLERSTIAAPLDLFRSRFASSFHPIFILCEETKKTIKLVSSPTPPYSHAASPTHASVFISHPYLLSLVRSGHLLDLPTTAAPPPLPRLLHHHGVLCIVVPAPSSSSVARVSTGEEVARGAMVRRRSGKHQDGGEILEADDSVARICRLCSPIPRDPSWTWRRWMEGLFSIKGIY